MSQTQQMWQELATLALIGSGRSDFQLPSAESNLGKVLTQFDKTDREGSLLGATSALWVYNRVGVSPSQYNAVLPKSSDDEERTICSADAVASLEVMLAGHYADVLPEWLKTVADTNQRVPPEILPELLEFVSSDGYLQQRIVPVIGEKGYWLAAQNSKWEFATKIEKVEEAWQNDNLAKRERVLENLRRSDPNKARELLQSTWAKEKPNDRVAFLENFYTNLSMADEPFLEQALDNKSEKVRKIAAEILSCLAESRLVQRMLARSARVMVWDVENSAIDFSSLDVWYRAWDKNSPRDGVGITLADYPEISGEKWIVHLVLSRTPPEIWLQRWRTTPENLIAAIRQNADWEKPLLLALYNATNRYHYLPVAEALIKLGLQNSIYREFARLTTLLPHSQQEQYMIEELKAKIGLQDDLYISFTVDCYVSNRNWSIELGRAFLQFIRSVILDAEMSVKYSDYTVNSALKTAACCMPVILLQEAETIWPTEAKNWNLWSGAATNFMSLLQFRADMYRAFG